MADVKFYLRIEKEDKEGKSPIELRYSYKTKFLRYYTGERVPEKDWDYKKEKVKRSFDGYTQINDLLDSLAEKTKQIVRRCLSEGLVPEPNEVKAELKPKAVVVQVIQFQKKISNREAFDNYFLGFREAQKLKGVGSNRLLHYNTFKKQFFEAAARYGYNLDLENYTLANHQLFLRHLVSDLDMMPNTVTKTIKILRVFFKYLAKVEKLQIHSDIDGINASFLETDKITLTFEELMHLMNFEFDANEPKSNEFERCRDGFVFGCFTGLRFSDIRKLNPNHIIELEDYRMIKFTQTKGSKHNTTVVLNEYADAIIRKYETKNIVRNGIKYALNIQINHKENVWLEEMLKHCGFNKMVDIVDYKNGEAFTTQIPQHKAINFHNARHTYAVLSLEKGMDITMLQKQLGHSDIQSTMVYARISDQRRHKESFDIWKKKE